MIDKNNKEGITEKQNNEAEVFCSLCEQTFFPPIDLQKYQIPEQVLTYIPERIARAYQVLPISRMGHVLTIVISEPSDIFLVDNLSLLTQLEISPVIATKKQILSAIEKYYSLTKIAPDKEKDVSGEDESSEISSFKEQKFNVEEITRISSETRVVNAVNKFLSDAVKSRASDIHIEPFEKEVRVRYRVDGILNEVKQMDKKYQQAIIARLKLMARLDITQKRMPQDGRFGFCAQDKEVDVRMSILPIDFGEKIVMRLLDKANVRLEIDILGFSPYALEGFKRAIAKPFGLILLTGPTGSGKTTTLYTLLNRINTIERNITTIEDPVEYNLPGVTQIPVRHEIELDFATILRATLRQSPDIIMVGEIRDFETVDIAMKAALTGHIVLSTLHTNDAPSAITRLLNMGVEPFLISSSLNLVAAQRLVRKICVNCKMGYKIDLSNYKDIPEEYRKKDVTLYKGQGCEECKNSGYKGRVAVAEVLSFDAAMRELIMKKASVDEIQEYARVNCGMKTLREDAMEKCLRGETTFEEVLRITLM
ncbi:MAG: GspE/PulE family protein [Candidatus Omnitrophota bacterium]